MLTKRIGNFAFPNTFKLGRNGPITQLGLRQHQACTLNFSWSLESSAASTASVPQQFLACRRRPLVDLASPVSKNLRTSRPFFPRHLPALHSNTWARRPLMVSTRGSFLKKTYMGEVHSFAISSDLGLVQLVYRSLNFLLNSVSALGSRLVSSMSSISSSSTEITSGAGSELLSSSELSAASKIRFGFLGA